MSETAEGRKEVIRGAMKMSVGVDKVLERLTNPLVIIAYKAAGKRIGEDTEMGKTFASILYHLEMARSQNMLFVSQALLELGDLELTPEVESSIKQLQDAIADKVNPKE